VLWSTHACGDCGDEAMISDLRTHRKIQRDAVTYDGNQPQIDNIVESQKKNIVSF
jgi:hypothetical protein